MKGRKSTTIASISFCLRIFARHASVIPLTAVLQFPAFFSSCTPAGEGAPAQSERQIYIQWTKNPITREADLFFFDTTGTRLLDAYQRIKLVEGQAVKALSRSGPRYIVVLSGLADGPAGWYGIRNYPDLLKNSFFLENDSPHAPLLWGETLVTEAAVDDVQLPLNPVLTHIHLRSVSCDFSALPYSGLTFFNTRLFLSYAGSECRPLGAGDVPEPISWLNAGALDSVSVFSLPHPEMVLQEGCGEIGSNRLYPERDFYCYPSPRTCLVLEGRVGTDVCYYPVPLHGLRPGKTYRLDLTLLRKGVPEPDIPMESGAVRLESLTFPWNHETPKTVNI